MIDDDLPSRSGTPKPVPDQDERGTKENGFSRDSRTQLDGEEGNGEEIAPSMELPTDVRVKLRKLEKLEGRYQGTMVPSRPLKIHTKLSRASALIQDGSCSRSNH